MPARVLEVGCGRGDLARAIAEAGHEVVAIDPHAPAGDLFRATSLEEFADPEPDGWAGTGSYTHYLTVVKGCAILAIHSFSTVEL